ncbi:cyclic-di-AMP receptor [Clostridiaceae bacterium HSG29]|nr:cyclic-di-AMP receptor [Clostridiaceae bacterium HSG29]
MKMIVAIVHDEDSHELIKKLTENEFNITKLASTGGFLKTGNTTLIIGVDKAKVDEALEIIANTCKTRKEYTMASSMIGETSSFIGQPIEVSVGGATVFVLDVDQFSKF